MERGRSPPPAPAPAAAAALLAAGNLTPSELCEEVRLNSTLSMALLLGTSADKDRVSNATARPEEECGSVSIVFPLTMMITGMVGNGLAMLLVYTAYHKKENQRKKSFLLCIGSLALTDLTGQLLTSPVVISVYLANRKWDVVDPSRHLCAFFGFSMTVFGLCPLFIASAMAIERTLAIRAPHWYSGHMKTRVTKSILLSVWLAIFAFALLPIVGVGKYTLQWPGTWCFISTRDGEGPRVGNIVFASTFAFLGLFSLVVTVACNVATIIALVCRCRSKSSVSQSRRQWGRITMETLMQLLGIMCVLFACWSPLLVGCLPLFPDFIEDHCLKVPAQRSEHVCSESNGQTVPFLHTSVLKMHHVFWFALSGHPRNSKYFGKEGMSSQKENRNRRSYFLPANSFCAQ